MWILLSELQISERPIRELLPRLGEEDRAVLEGRERAAALSAPETPEFRALCERLISWSSRLIREYGAEI